MPKEKNEEAPLMSNTGFRGQQQQCSLAQQCFGLNANGRRLTPAQGQS